MDDDNLTEEPTKKLTPFERMVLARFDDLARTLGTFQRDTNERLEKLEAKALDTKPIWAQALTEIAEIKAEIAEVKAEIAELKAEIAEVKAEVAEVKAQTIEIKSKVTVLDRRLQNVERAIVALVADGGLLTPSQ